MASGQFIASVHKDYLPFVSLATDAELAQFVRAQISQANGDELPELTGMAKALYDAHIALIARLEESSRKKSEAGKRGGNPTLKQNGAEVKHCLSSDKAEDIPVSVTVTDTDSIDTPPTPQGGEGEVPTTTAQRKAELRVIRDSYTFSQPLNDATNSWIRYKNNKRQRYEPEGFRNLLSTIRNKAAKYGDSAVVDLITVSMAQNYTGITWDKLNNLPAAKGQQPADKIYTSSDFLSGGDSA
jgi:hypothetical protein